MPENKKEKKHFPTKLKFSCVSPLCHRPRHDGGGRRGERQLEEERSEGRAHRLALSVNEPGSERDETGNKGILGVDINAK